MATLKDKLTVTAITAGAYGAATYGAIKFQEDEVPNMEWETTSDKLKTIGKYAAYVLCYVGAVYGCGILTAVTIAAWKDK